MAGREPGEAILERAIKAACEDFFYECTYPVCNEVPKGCGIPQIIRAALAAIGSGAGRDAVIDLDAKVRALRDEILFCCEGGISVDALNKLWDLLASALASPEKAADPYDVLRQIAEEMDQFVRVRFRDSYGNTVYVNINYIGDGAEYDNLDSEKAVPATPAPPTPCGYLWERAKEAYERLNHLYGDRAIRQMARILAEAKAEGWEDAVKALRQKWRERTWDSDCWVADWLTVNRPSPTGPES